ncbi:MAG: ATP-binding protein [Actinomycetota bacterium]|nr:ATP-binding protein [Actinomycetota bacterium]
MATQLVDLAVDRWRFGLSAEGEPFALPLHGAQVVRMLTGSRSIHAELGDLFQARTGKVAGQQALADAVLTLEGRARRVEPVPLALRVAGDDCAVWLDLGTLTGEAVKITPAGWQVEPEPPILFRRTALSGVLPEPVAGGDLGELWTLLNVAPESRPVLLAWLVAALLPDIPHPVAALVGEQGTGKSTASRMLTGLLDPSPAQLRKPPRDVDGWTTAAAGSWVVGVDNVSAVADWWSDSLCRAVTGDGDVRRRLYSDADLTVFAFRRVVLLNGVDLGTVRDDLADRLLTVELHRITDRQLDANIAHAWAQAHPRILGALLDLAAKVLRVLPGMTVADLPRMADYARLLAAVDQVLGTDGLATYRQLAADLAADAVTGDPVLSAITQTLTAPWVGTAAELLGRLGDRPEHGKAWPRSARGMTGLLRRKAPSLRRVGWQVDDLGRGGHNKAMRFLLRPPDSAGDADVVRTLPATRGRCADVANTDIRTPSPPVTCADTESADVADVADVDQASLLLDLMNEERESAETTPYEIGGETPSATSATSATTPDGWWTFPPAPPAPPAHCAGCSVELTPARAGRNTRCPSCWDELLANQPESSS